MARKPNDGRGRIGGRKKGTPNKDKKKLHEKAEELGVDPFEILLLIAKGDWKGLGYVSETVSRVTKEGIEIEIGRIELRDRLNAAKEACNYIHPKRKAIEVSSDEGNITINLATKVSLARERAKKVK